MKVGLKNIFKKNKSNETQSFNNEKLSKELDVVNEKLTKALIVEELLVQDNKSKLAEIIFLRNALQQAEDELRFFKILTNKLSTPSNQFRNDSVDLVDNNEVLI
jgi:flagellar hook-basal body complex protein FliE